MHFPDISCATFIELFNWAIEAQLGSLGTESVIPTGELDADSTFAVLRNSDFLSEVSPIVYTGDIDSISDDELRGAIALYLCLQFDEKSYLEASYLASELPKRFTSNFADRNIDGA